MNRNRRLAGLSERRNFQFRIGANGERKYSAIAALDRATAQDIGECCCASPTNHESDVLNAVLQISHGRSHDAGASVEVPKSLPVGSAIGAEDSVRTAFKVSQRLTAKGIDRFSPIFREKEVNVSMNRDSTTLQRPTKFCGKPLRSMSGGGCSQFVQSKRSRRKRSWTATLSVCQR